MNFPEKALLGSLLLLSTTSAFAVDTADLRVIGTIAPTACTPTFSGGGTVDYGIIPTASLSPTINTVLAERSVSYTIHCDAPISIGTSWVDSRAGTKLHTTSLTAFGLGLAGANKIGQYSIIQSQGGVTGDGGSVDLIQSDSATGPWILSTGGAQRNDGVRIQAYAPPGTLVPGAYTEYAGTLTVRATIAPTSTLDLSSSITLDGLSTMTVRYL